ncbi:unnamed protein product, partial [Rotaria socialis]
MVFALDIHVVILTPSLLSISGGGAIET